MGSEERRGEAVQELVCSICNAEVYICDGCKEYFQKGAIVFCIDDKHYCDNCFEPRGD